MKNISKLFISIVGCELVGIVGTPFTFSAIPAWYAGLNKPFFAPPNWIFGPVWTILYFLIGLSFYLIWKNGWKKPQNITARNYFLAQLGLNLIWSPVFFGLKSPFLALLIILAMLVLIVITIKKFNAVSRWPAILLIPYLVWVSFASFLNLAIVALN